jgi:hypothetical protein
LSRFRFARAAAGYFRVLGAKAQVLPVSLLPPKHPLRVSTGGPTATEAADYYLEKATAAAKKLDQRNGNSYYSDLIKKDLAEKQL